jgi:mannitol-1-/sugar-/sorbitol-6-phosphatase
MAAISLTCSGILLDLDGVLVDSSAAVTAAWNQWAAEHGIDADSGLDQAHGRSTLDQLRAVVPEFASEEEACCLDALEEAHLDTVTAQPGAHALVDALTARQARWGVVTSCETKAAQARLAAAGIRRPRVLVCGNDGARGKPFPDPYLLGATLIGCAPEHVVVLEDAPVGIAAARAAGMTVVAVTTTHIAQQLSAAQHVVGDLSHVGLGGTAGKTIEINIG